MSTKHRRLSVKSIKENLKYEVLDNQQQTVGSCPKTGPSIGVRHKQMILLFLLILIIYSMRVNLSVAIVAMTDPSASSNPNVPTYNWSDKSVVLSAFFWGYILPQIGAGWLGNIFGPKWFLVVTIFLGSLSAILTPCIAHLFGSKGVMGVRAFQGFTQGFVYPSVHGLLSKWVPISERSRLGTFVYAAAPLGTCVSMIVSGLLASSSYGWPTIFYFFGTVGLLWCLLFSFLGYNQPSEAPNITEEETNYIMLGSGVSTEKKTIETPWLKIFSSLPVWAIILTQSGFNWGYLTLITQTPIYMNKIMNFDIKSNSVLSALPYLFYWILSIAVSFSSDFVVNKKILSIGISRKIYNTLGLLVPSVALVYLGNCNTTNITTAVLLVFLAISGSAFLQCGFLVNHLDIAPNHASTLMGITNCLSNIFGILAPLVVQFVVKDETDASQWKTIFFISASVNVVACAAFILFASGKIQKWNYSEKIVVQKDDLLLARRLSSVI